MLRILAPEGQQEVARTLAKVFRSVSQDFDQDMLKENQHKKTKKTSPALAKQKVKKKILEFQSEKNEEGNNLDEDLYKPGYPVEFGSQHPLNITRKNIIEIFEKIGYCISEGPEIEDDWHNFTALNLPKHHPARDMQDTFFINKDPDILLRTHTSSVQIRYMENNTPPIKTISPGRVYRNEDISARSHCLFHQVEGLYIDKEVSFANLKHTIDCLLYTSPSPRDS